MNKRPVYYMQTDSRWKDIRLKCAGGTMSIGGGGCGPTSAAMLIETVTGKQCLPTETMKWCCENGYVFANQGTSYYAFKPLFQKYGIDCAFSEVKCLSASSPLRKVMIDRLKDGYYLIALMTKGLWTSGGHFIVVWWADNKIRINDPASTKDERLNGDPNTFFSQAKYFWLVDARAINKATPVGKAPKEEKMDIDAMIDKMTPEQAQRIVDKAERFCEELPLPDNWDAQGELLEAMELGITDGSRPMVHATRLETAVMVKRATKL